MPKVSRTTKFTAEEVANFTRFIESAMARIASATSFLEVVREAINGKARIENPPGGDKPLASRKPARGRAKGHAARGRRKAGKVSRKK